jgi:serine/threonine protein kinase
VSNWTVPGYTELKPLGAGGFGAVMLAVHDTTGTPVAIKYLNPGLRDDPGFAALFRAEAVALGSLDNPYVVKLYEYVESPSGAAIVMELVEGVTLRDVLAQYGTTSPEAAAVVLYGSLLGLAAAHSRGVVHRDYKPANVLVNAYGVSKLTDFGIAARTGSTTIPAGSLAYAPPEQFDGGPASPASDVYAATATFYECLVGEPPFGREAAQSQAELMERHRSAEVPMGPVPEPLQQIVAFGLAKHPAYRPADATALAGALRTAAAAAYGAEWEQRARWQLGEAALLLTALWPTAGVPALSGYAVEQVQLAQNARSAMAAHGGKAATDTHVSQAAAHHAHLWHVSHLRHLAHLRFLRRGAGRPGMPKRTSRLLQGTTVAVTTAAVAAAAVTWAATRTPASAPGSPGHPVLSAFPVSLVTVPIAAASGSAPVTGNTFVYYNSGKQSAATIRGSIKGAARGEVVRLYARQFPYTSAPALVGTSTLDPAGGTAAYSFQVTPTLATRYQAELFSSASETVPIGQSAATTVYVVLGEPYLHVNCPTGQAVCSIQTTETFYAPAPVLQQEMSKHWYIYAGANNQPGPNLPPNPASLQLNALSSAVSNPQRTGGDSFTLTVTLSYNRGSDATSFVWWACSQDTEGQDGLGLPGSHGCGTESVIPTSTPYLG